MDISRRTLLGAAAGCILPRWPAIQGNPPSPTSSWATDLEFLRQMTIDVLRASRVEPGSNGPPGWPIKNSVGFGLYTPGRGGYPAFWMRDFSMALDSGLVPAEEIRNHLLLVARCQSGPNARRLQSGGVIPAFSIPDHINFDGTPVYYPGTYSPGEDQGDGAFGRLPPADDHFEFIHMAAAYQRTTKDSKLLQSRVGDLTLLARLERAFYSPDSDPSTGLIETTEVRRSVGFGFCDGIVITGKILFASLLRHRAAGELAAMTGEIKYKRCQEEIARNLPSAFLEKSSGWLLASTGIGRQPDVWGTCYALHLGILDKVTARKAAHAVAHAYRTGTICFEGGVRHIPTDRDYSATSAWERTYETKNTYQNGAYWHTPTGWLISALMRTDRALASQAFSEFVEHLRRNDYRLGKPGLDAPWECYWKDGQNRQNGAYLASVALPYGVIKTLDRF